MAEPYIITGFRVQPDDVFPRYEIRDLQKDHPEQFTLFILGWTKIRQPDYRPRAAQYVQQGGIHGRPYERWPGDPHATEQAIDRENWGGYCHHKSALFPTWHRVVVLLLEQSIGEAALGIAQEFAKQYPEEEAKWLQAARELRFPFWDWTLPATGKEGLPKIFNPDQSLTLKGPRGQTIQSENILAFYKFGSSRPAGFANLRKSRNSPEIQSYYADWDRTYRRPNSSKNPKENYGEIDLNLQGKIPNPVATYDDLFQTVGSLFIFPFKTDSDAPRASGYPEIWDEFSNAAKVDRKEWRRGTFAGSLESPHDLLHVILGGKGHMANKDYAAFDPIFYLHHCNVDRLYAFWEYVYPDYWIGDASSDYKFTEVEGTFTEDSKKLLTEKTNLTPFRKTAEAYWTSSDTRSLEVKPGVAAKHYTYPELANVRVERPATDEERKKHLLSLQIHFGVNPIKSRNRWPTLRQGLFSSNAETALPPGQEPVVEFRRFIVNVELVEHAFDGSYLLVLTAKAGQEDLRVGAVAVFGRGDSGTRCAACRERREAGSEVVGVIQIPTGVIYKIIEAKGLNREDAEDHEVISALKGSFYARLVRPDGEVLAEVTRDGTSIGGEPLPEPIVPKLTLHSANLSAPEQPEIEHDPRSRQDALPDGPFQYYDWQDHVNLLDGEWKMVSGA